MKTALLGDCSWRAVYYAQQNRFIETMVDRAFETIAACYVHKGLTRSIFASQAQLAFPSPVYWQIGSNQWLGYRLDTALINIHP